MITQTLSSLTDFLYIPVSPPSQSTPQIVVTNLLIFLSFSFLLVAVWWLSYSCRCLLHCREVKMFVCIARNVIFLSL